MKRLLVLTAAMTMVAVLSAPAPSHAEPIIYTTATIASGTLGGAAFSNTLVTVTLTGDTADVFAPDPVNLPGVFGNIGTATLSITGLGTATFNDPNGYAAVLFQQPFPPEIPFPGFAIFEGLNAANDQGTGIFGLFDASLAGYDLQSPFGPLTGTGVGVATNPDGTPVAFSTTAGDLRLAGGGNPVTLTVTVPAVPEPPSLALFGLIAVAAAVARHRRQRS